jgi:glycosyltransferase involved in cell wall biosynthesis
MDKGVDLFLEAIEILRKNSENAIGILVGEVEDKRLLHAIQIAKEQSSIIHIPYIRDIRPYLKFAKINCLPSRREGLPNVVLEASALGIPNVVSDATGCVDSVINNETGFIIPSGSPKKLAESFEKLSDEHGSVYIVENQGYAVFKRESDNKILKPITYRSPDNLAETIYGKNNQFN